MGRFMPPYYHKEDIMAIIDKITKVDEKINELAIEREAYVKEFKDKIKESDTTEDQD